MVDPEIEAVAKCFDSLKELENNAKIRVFKYLFERFELGSHFINASHDEHIKNQVLISHKINQEEIIEIESNKETVAETTLLTEKPKKKKNNNGKTVSLISSLNLNPSDKKHLRDFYKEFSISSYMENNLLFIYYLDKILNEENISPNHIYTCYKHLGLKVPNSIYQSLLDTKGRKGWIDTSNINNIKTSISGENYLEHDVQKAVINV